MRRYVIEWYAVGRWQRIGRTWWTRWGARRAAKRVQRTAVCHATKIIRLPQHGCARVRPQGQSGPIHHPGVPARLSASHVRPVSETNHRENL